MANNPFSIGPVSSNIGAGIGQLGRSLGALGQAQKAQEKEDALKQRQADALTAIKGAIDSDDNEALADVMLEYPEYSQVIDSQIGFRSKATKENMLQGLRDVIAYPERTEQLLTDRVKMVQEAGGDPSLTVAELDLFRRDPEQFKAGAERAYAMMDPAGYKSYQSTLPQKSEVKPHTNMRTTKSGEMIGYNPETRAYEKIPSPEEVASGAPQVNVNITDQPEFEKEIQKLNAKAYSGIASSAKDLRSQESKIDRLIQLNDKAFEGAGSGAKVTIGQLAKNFGVDVDGLAESEAFRAVSNELVLDKSQQMSGALSEGDMAFLKDTTPNLSNTKEGRKQVFDYSKKLIERQKEYVKKAKEFRKEKGYFDQAEFEDEFQTYADENPLFETPSADKMSDEQLMKSLGL